MPAAHQPKGYDQCPNQKVVPNTSCPPTKTCPMLTAHQTRKFGHHYMYLLLLSVPLNHKAVPNAHCCTNCAMSKACCPTITRLCPLHAAQGHIPALHAAQGCFQYMLPTASTIYTCCSLTINLYPMPATPQSKSCQCIPLPTARLLASIAYHSTTTTFTCLHSAPQPQCGTPLQCHLISTSSHSMHTLNVLPLNHRVVTNACWHAC